METTTIPTPFELTIELTDDQFFQLCQNNRDLRFERSASGDLTVMPPTGSETGNRNIKISAQLEIWSSQNNLGLAFDSSTGFKLPNGANRSPDAAWVSNQRWEVLTTAEKEKFAPLSPDFVVELRSKTDSLEKLQAKMQEYIENGTKLGWLIDRHHQRVEIYRPNQTVEIILSPQFLSGENILPGFVLDLKNIL
ncbi:conserved hypothetical protein [Planktothrix sp. PCC 11201]|uniref:Uma2 family endonuclease n=1 Tax=Planktothrix sp. PCC 11201 TaxID=1729650 RepID=UPI00091BD2E7|nr:Uma2 family endonuclease [Planktothrix sp. PCC 11201]SKB15470.1 conserved hypothetical protein [Planktothrix sp. PCC 11201]